MNYFKSMFFLLVLVVAACQEQDRSKTIPAIEQSISKIEVIDFYGTHRCVTCEAIEANAEYTVDTYFPEEKKNGTIVFKAVNVDEEENYELAERFEASGTALFLNVINNGVETHIDLTNFGFSKGKEKEVFSTELKAKIETELNKL